MSWCTVHMPCHYYFLWTHAFLKSYFRINTRFSFVLCTFKKCLPSLLNQCDSANQLDNGPCILGCHLLEAQWSCAPLMQCNVKASLPFICVCSCPELFLSDGHLNLLYVLLPIDECRRSSHPSSHASPSPIPPSQSAVRRTSWPTHRPGARSRCVSNNNWMFGYVLMKPKRHAYFIHLLTRSANSINHRLFNSLLFFIDWKARLYTTWNS